MKSIILTNALKDPNYRPYCMRCRGLVRMEKIAPLFWRCKCGAEHEEKIPAVPSQLPNGESRD